MRKESKSALPIKKTDDPDFIGSHLAIDFVNTVRVVDRQVTDTLQSDNDVKLWLARSGVPSSTEAKWPRGDLLAVARRLREMTLDYIQSRKAGKKPALKGLNDFLATAAGHIELARHGDSVTIARVYRGRTPQEYLGPIAEAVADLLANADFDLVRQCEGEQCVLWFYDRTKSHHRRFCSAEICGNRAKVAAYRARQQTPKSR